MEVILQRKIPEVHCGILLRITATPFCTKTITHYIHRGRLCPVTPASTHFMWDGGVTEENDQSSALLLKTAARAVPVNPSAAEGRFIFGATSALIRCWSGSNLASRVRSIIFCSVKVRPMANQTRKTCTWNKMPSQSCAFNPPLPSLSHETGQGQADLSTILLCIPVFIQVEGARD